ncbi:MFS transporter [Bacillus changyiensis]|uniref:MFS transporter n=1 Tax=Bacillus changyiensis TaxID=3004103 RepID=UPI00374201A7
MHTTIICFMLSAFFWFNSYLSSSSLVTLISFGLAFIPIGIHNVTLNTIIQTLVSEEMIGRVFAIVGSLSALFLPIGSLLGGYLSTFIDIRSIYGLGGLAILFISIYWLITPKLRTLPAPAHVTEEHRAKEHNFN